MIWLSYVITFFIGYFVGINYCVNVKEKSTETLQDVYRKVRLKIKPTRVGPIDRVSYSDQLKKGTRLEETEKAIEETLNDVL